MIPLPAVAPLHEVSFLSFQGPFCFSITVMGLWLLELEDGFYQVIQSFQLATLEPREGAVIHLRSSRWLAAQLHSCFLTCSLFIFLLQHPASQNSTQLKQTELLETWKHLSVTESTHPTYCKTSGMLSAGFFFFFETKWMWLAFAYQSMCSSIPSFSSPHCTSFLGHFWLTIFCGEFGGRLSTRAANTHCLWYLLVR